MSIPHLLEQIKDYADLDTMYEQWCGIVRSMNKRPGDELRKRNGKLYVSVEVLREMFEDA